MITYTGNRHRAGAFLAMAILIAAGALQGTACAQEPDRDREETLIPAIPATGLDGFHIYSLSGSYGYASLPLTILTSLPSTNPNTYGPEMDATTAGSFGYSHRLNGSRGRFTMIYNPSYSRYFTYAGLNSLSQNLSLSFTTLVGRHWTFTFNAVADDSTLAQYLFEPFAAGSLSNPSSIDDIIGTAGTPGGLTASAAQAALFGVHRRSASGDLALAYRPTTRWTLSTRLYAVDTASVNSSSQQDIPDTVPHMFTAEGFLNANYALTPSTQIGAEGAVMQSRSAFANYQVITGRLMLQKRFARRWFATLDGGVANQAALANSLNAPHGTSYVYAGSLGYAGKENSFLATYNRQLGDYYGYASGSTNSAYAYWNWRNRAQTWGFNASGGRQRLEGGEFGNLTIWEATAGLSRAIGRQATMSWSYVNLVDSAPSIRPGNFSVHAVRVTMLWIPFLREVRPRVNIP